MLLHEYITLQIEYKLWDWTMVCYPQARTQDRQYRIYQYVQSVAPDHYYGYAIELSNDPRKRYKDFGIDDVTSVEIRKAVSAMQLRLSKKTLNLIYNPEK